MTGNRVVPVGELMTGGTMLMRFAVIRVISVVMIIMVMMILVNDVDQLELFEQRVRCGRWPKRHQQNRNDFSN